MEELWSSPHPVANNRFEGTEFVYVCVNTKSDRKLNAFTAMMSFENDPVKVPNFKPLSFFVFSFALAYERISIKAHRQHRKQML